MPLARREEVRRGGLAADGQRMEVGGERRARRHGVIGQLPASGEVRQREEAAPGQSLVPGPDRDLRVRRSGNDDGQLDARRRRERLALAACGRRRRVGAGTVLVRDSDEIGRRLRNELARRKAPGRIGRRGRCQVA